MATMTKRPEVGEIRTDANGVEHIFEACDRCGGTGYTVFVWVDGGRCFSCPVWENGTPTGGRWVKKADFDRRAKARATYAKNQQRKADELAAALPGKITALIVAHPILAELLKLEDYSGLLGSFRSQLEKKGALSDKQIALVKKIVIEDAERQAHAENERRGRVEGPIGDIGERRDFTGKIVWFLNELNPFSYHESYTTVMIIATDEGAIKWKSSKELDVQLGQQVTVKATVKEHSVDKNSRIITVVTRGKLTN